MKPFNLNEYLANPSREIITEDGRPVRIVCTDAKNCRYPIIALVEIDGKERVIKYTENGTYLEGVKHKQDLCFKPVTKKGWVNIFKPVNQMPCILTSVIYNTKEDALHFIEANNQCANPNCIKTICIEWEED